MDNDPKEQALALRPQIERLEHAIKEFLPGVECPVRHHFAKGVYGREMFIPAGTVLTGKIHKHTNLNIMTQGDMSVLVDGVIKRVRAPFTVVSPPGTKRAAYAHTDTVWMTIHGTNETDVDKIENECIAATYEEYLEYCEQVKLEHKR